MKDHIAKQAKSHSLIQELIKLHESASGFSAHSSVSSIAYKYKRVIDAERGKEKVSFDFFDAIELPDFFAYYFGLIRGYFLVFQLFYNEFFKKELRIVYPEREKRIADFEAKIILHAKRYPSPKISNIIPEPKN